MVVEPVRIFVPVALLMAVLLSAPPAGAAGVPGPPPPPPGSGSARVAAPVRDAPSDAVQTAERVATADVDAGVGTALHPVERTRLLRSGLPGGTVDGQSQSRAPVPPGHDAVVRVSGRGGIATAGVTGVLATIWTRSKGVPGDVTLRPSGTDPSATAVTVTAGRSQGSEQRILPVGADGSFVVRSRVPLEITVDVTAWTSADPGSASFTVPADTRTYLATDITSASATPTGAVIVVSPAAAPPVQGGHVALGVMEDFPDGMFAAVTAVRRQQDGTVQATLEPAAVDEVYDDVRLDVDRDVELEVVPVDASGARASGGAGGDFSVAAADSAAWTCSAQGVPTDAQSVWSSEWPLPVSLDLEHTRVLHQFDAGNALLGRDPFLLFQFSGEAVAKVQVEVRASFSCQLSPTFRRQHRLRAHVANIGVVPVSVNLEPTLEFGVDRAVSFGLAQRHYFAFTVQQDGDAPFSFRRAHSNDPVTATASSTLTASVFAGGDLSVMLGGGYKSANAQAGIFGAFGPELSAGVDLRTPRCVDFEAAFRADLGVRLELWVKRWDLEVASLTVRDLASGALCLPGGPGDGGDGGDGDPSSPPSGRSFVVQPARGPAGLWFDVVSQDRCPVGDLVSVAVTDPAGDPLRETYGPVSTAPRRVAADGSWGPFAYRPLVTVGGSVTYGPGTFVVKARCVGSDGTTTLAYADRSVSLGSQLRVTTSTTSPVAGSTVTVTPTSACPFATDRISVLLYTSSTTQVARSWGAVGTSGDWAPQDVTVPADFSGSLLLSAQCWSTTGPSYEYAPISLSVAPRG